MAMNFGFATIDATGFDFSSESAQTIVGSYKQCDDAYNSGMPVILYGWDYNSVPISPTPVYVMPSTNAYIIDGKISVSNADVITIL